MIHTHNMKNINAIRVQVNAKRWPYQNKSLLLRGRKGDTAFLLETNTSGNIIFTGTHGYISKKIVTQPIIIDKPGLFYLYVDFNSQKMDFKILANKAVLLEESKAFGNARLVITKPY
jgi:hypothetical protein